MYFPTCYQRPCQLSKQWLLRVDLQSLMVTHGSPAAVHCSAAICMKLSSPRPTPSNRTFYLTEMSPPVLSNEIATGHQDQLYHFWVSVQNKNAGLSDQKSVIISSGWQQSITVNHVGLLNTAPYVTVQVTHLRSWPCWPRVVNEHLKCDWCVRELRSFNLTLISLNLNSPRGW